MFKTYSTEKGHGSTPPEKKTDKTLHGEGVQLTKKRGRPYKLVKRNPDYYPLETRLRAASQFAVLGDLDKVSALTDIPVGTLRRFMQEIWWDEVIHQIHNEENAKISSKLTTVAIKALDEFHDRLENGDHFMDRKTGETYRMPVRAQNLSKPIASLVTSRQLLRGEATTRTEKIDTESRLEQLAARFSKFAKKEIDITPSTLQLDAVEDAVQDQG